MTVARAWGTDPVTLRQATKAEYDEMVGRLVAECDAAADAEADRAAAIARGEF